MMPYRQLVFATLTFISIGISCADHPSSMAASRLLTEYHYKTFYRIANSRLASIPKWEAWKTAVPGIEEISIRSTYDSSSQPALFFDSGSDRDKPLLLVLHSWSANYLQHFSIPYGVWARRNDWVLIHPDYRGAFTNPKATASEHAQQDILDALSWAMAHARIDRRRVYVAGFSGGAMVTLLMVGRYPEVFAGAVAWVPVYDLVDWYTTTKGARHDYSDHIENSCGGPPIDTGKAQEECRKRSVSTYLKNARGKAVQVYIATGIRDNFVPPAHSIRAFNDLAADGDRMTNEQIKFIEERAAIPPGLSGAENDSLFADVDREVLFRRTSGNATLTIFDGRHDVIYNAGLLWLSRQKMQ